MNLHEYQAKSLLAGMGMPCPKEIAIQHITELPEAWRTISSENKGAVLKAQVHAGGRGKAGGVKVTLCSRVDDGGTGCSGRRNSTLPASGDTTLRRWRSLPRWRNPPPEHELNHCQNRGQLQSPSSYSNRKKQVWRNSR